MALESPMHHSPGALMSAFSPYTDSPASPALPRSPAFPTIISERPASDTTDRSRPQSRPQSLSARPEALRSSLVASLPSVIEPGQTSPVASSQGTGGTDIEEGPEIDPNPQMSPEHPGSQGSVNSHATIRTIDTAIPLRPPSAQSETPQSVIHAPRGFKTFDTEDDEPKRSPLFEEKHRKTPSPSRRSDFLTAPETSPSAQAMPTDPSKSSASPISPPPISTDVERTDPSLDHATPRAQTRQEVEIQDRDKYRSHPPSDLEDIPESGDQEHYAEYGRPEHEQGIDHKPQRSLPDLEQEIKALKAALDECWTLCNTLAGLSSIHRERIFNHAGSGDMQEQAWKSCWKLCQKLYDTREEKHDHHVRPTLDLCRDFCQSLFEVRLRENEVADSVLRVSFELNNHLYNTHDRNLPEAFRERTLDFYITLCHRLMKQKSSLAEETDSLLRACWSLAEMLFSLRQNHREGKAADDELLGSAVQACWELCDLFREGWTQVRPDRGTPRPSQTTFTQTYSQMKQAEQVGVAAHSAAAAARQRRIAPALPETPTTIFEDIAASPDGEEIPPPPNILVLGTDNQRVGARWSSNASTLSDYSQTSSQGTSSTTTTTMAAAEDVYLTSLKILLIKAAIDSGFQHRPGGGQTMNTFAKSLSSNAFGTQPWQMKLLENYRKLVLSDAVFRAPVKLGSKVASAGEVARAVLWMVRSGNYSFLRDLFRLVFGFHLEDAERRPGVLIQV